ncbi:MAG: hypothetical protein MN733_03515 [Nitrososphaera sp.]|nr:hypothetical protein [Nitrososphaera sp.]
MANKSLFGSTTRGKTVPATDTVNASGGKAYAFTHEHALASMAFTGTFNDTTYETGADQLTAIKTAAEHCTPTFIAQTAIAAREQGYMKDMPAALAAILSKRDPALLDKVFDRIIDNGKQLRNFVQFIRSGQFGRKSLGSGPKRLVKRWLNSKSDHALFKASVGNSPSLADVIKMVHPRPGDVQVREGADAAKQQKARGALYAYLLGKDHNFNDLPKIVRDYECFKAGDRTAGVPDVDFRMLTSLPLSNDDWKEIAKNGAWHQTRMNLNTYARHGVLEDHALSRHVADKLRDATEIERSKVFPYQLLAAYLNTESTGDEAVPQSVRNALQDAMELAVENVPSYEGNVAVVVDVSGSMQSAITGYRKGATSKVRAVDVAALVAAAILRKNPNAVIVPVDTVVHSAARINPRDTVMTIATQLAKFGGGGTRLGAALQHLEKSKTIPDLIVMVSDNESWMGGRNVAGTEIAHSWSRIRARNPRAKMVCVDTLANQTTQILDGEGVMNCGGFSDSIFDAINRFVSGEGPDTWVNQIKGTTL